VIEREEGQLGERLSIPDLVALYERSEREIRGAFGTVAGALRNLNLAFLGTAGGFDVRLRSRHYSNLHVDFDNPDDVLTELRRDIWRMLIERASIRRAMSVGAWKELTEKVDKEDPPPVTTATIQAMIDQFQADMPEMLKAAVHEVFDFLRPPSSRYKTNSEYEVGERVVLSHCVCRRWGRTWDTEHHRDQQLIALENVFAMVDGKVATRTGYYADIALEIKRMPTGEPCHGGTPYMEFRGYANGNLHLKFRRMDLVKKLNAIAGGARLKPSRAA